MPFFTTEQVTRAAFDATRAVIRRAFELRVDAYFARRSGQGASRFGRSAPVEAAGEEEAGEVGASHQQHQADDRHQQLAGGADEAVQRWVEDDVVEVEAGRRIPLLEVQLAQVRGHRGGSPCRRRSGRRRSGLASRRATASPPGGRREPRRFGAPAGVRPASMGDFLGVVRCR